MVRCSLIAGVLAATLACSQDYEVNPDGSDVEAPETGDPEPNRPPRDPRPEDTGALDEETEPEDTGAPDTEPVDDSEPIEDSEPVVEEDPPPADDCDHTSDKIYVVDRQRDALYLFDPTTLAFTLVGALDCGMWSGTPGSMAVSRDGFGYVRYSDDLVYQVDLTTMACSPTAYGGSFGTFGMGFATNDGSTWRDTLYVANDRQLATLDTASWAVGTLGSMPSQSELTGNADGELWSFLPLENPARLSQIDKATGAELAHLNLPSFPNPFNIDAFAFATWGGEFWLFVREFGMGQTTDVYRVTADGVMSTPLRDSGMDIVGAGVSTCAPS
jgi:hypothetical protein